MPLALAEPSSTPVTPRAEPPPIRETDLDRALKLIPTEVLAFYTAAAALAPQVPSQWRQWFPLGLFVVGLVLVPIVLFVDGKNTNQPARASQYVVRTLAFVAWASVISWPFAPWIDGGQLIWLRSLAVLIVPVIGTLVVRGGATLTHSP